MVLQDELPGIVGRPLRDHIDADSKAPTSTVRGYWPLANIICNLQEDGVSLLLWHDHQQAARVGIHRKVSDVDCHTDGLLEGMMPSLNIQSPSSFNLWRDNGMLGVGRLKSPTKRS